MRGRDQGGSATVEFALVLPLILVVLLAVVQVGLVLRDRLALANAARESARVAAVGDTDAEVRAAAERSGLSPITVQIVRDPQPGGPVEVTVRYVSLSELPLIGWLVPDTQMAANVVMRQESGVALP